MCLGPPLTFEPACVAHPDDRPLADFLKAYGHMRGRRRRRRVFVHYIIEYGRPSPCETKPALWLNESNPTSQSALTLRVIDVPKKFIWPAPIRYHIGPKGKPWAKLFGVSPGTPNTVNRSVQGLRDSYGFHGTNLSYATPNLAPRSRAVT